MKNLIFLSTLVLITSCGNPQKDRVVEHVKSQLKDPKSFELLKYELKDTIYKSDDLALAKKDIGWQLKVHEGEVELFTEFIGHGSTYWSNDLVEAQSKVTKLKSQMDSVDTEITKLKESGVNPVYMYEHFVSCYGVNTLGMRVIMDLRVFEVVEKGTFEISKLDPKGDFK